VVGHGAVGEQAHRVASDGLGEGALEGVIIAVIVEEGEARIGAVQGVVDEPAFGAPEPSYQGPRLGFVPGGSQERFLTASRLSKLFYK
jgi:hypothetical protein